MHNRECLIVCKLYIDDKLFNDSDVLLLSCEVSYIPKRTQKRCYLVYAVYGKISTKIC